MRLLNILKPKGLSQLSLSLLVLLISCNSSAPRRLEILFLGHLSEHHNSAKFAPILSAYTAKSGINITYSENPEDLNESYLKLFDGLVLYANHDSISSTQEHSLLNFVRQGKGFIPLHAASYCFRNSSEVVAMIGGQFKEHGYEKFTANITNTTHETMVDLSDFETSDETYVHHLLNDDLSILMEREENGRKEPWTWVRNEGKGRVFYTAYGHDENTWGKPEFLKLVQNGILWAVSEESRTKLSNYQVAELSYQDEIIPNYEKKDPAPKFQLPLDAEASMSHIQIPPGFELELFAQEPMIINPINMNWDHLGRLWVIETVDYPNTVRQEDGIGDDTIKILEDTNGDGKADKVTVFADKLNIPTSMVFVNGGVLVSQAPHFLFLKDTDGDDKADIREIAITGWGVTDTHAGPSNLRYGFDNRIWGTVGYSGFQGEVGGKSHHFDQVLYHFSTDFDDLNIHSYTSNNTWGLGFTENFDLFISTANNTHSAFASVPAKYMRRVKGFGRDVVSKLDGHYFMHPATENFRQVDVFGGFTAAAGHSFYTARNYPKEYWNRVAFVSEPTGHLLHRAIIEPFGSGFLEKDGWNLLSSSDEWVSPVQAETGPDGNVWILDWYNFIIQHNPIPEGFENGDGNAHVNPLRDKKHGRIYRLVSKKVTEKNSISLDLDDPNSLLEGLKSDNLFWRLNAQRLIIENNYTELEEDLISLISSSPEDEIGINAPAIHAIWTLRGLGTSSEDSEKALTAALQNSNAGVRKAAIQALPNTAQSTKHILNNKALVDKNLNTRLAAIIKIMELPESRELGEIIYQLSRSKEIAQDLWLSKALQAAALVHKSGFIEAYENLEQGGPTTSLTSKIYLNYNTQNYTLKSGAYVPEALEVKGKTINIEGRIWVPKPEDLITHMLVAHGDDQNGYGVYYDQGYWSVVVNQMGKTYSGRTEFDAGNWFGFEFNMTNTGVATLEINNEIVVQVKTRGLFTKDFTQGIRLGDSPKNIRSVNSSIKSTPFTQSLVNVAAEISTPGEIRNIEKPDLELRLGVVPQQMKFDKDTLEAKAGQLVSIIFDNPDFMQHNLLIIAPDKLEDVGAAADAMVAQSDAAEKNYIPDTPEVLFASQLLNPNEQTRLTFRVPNKPGTYPFVCTFPGHWRTMNGVLIVK